MKKKIKNIFLGTYVRGFVTLYALFTFVGAVLLMLPISLKEGQELSFIDALFVSVSGMSTTGLSTVVVADVLTRFGQLILAFIIQFGGIGLIMLLAVFWMFTGKNISYKERQFIVTDQNQVKSSKVVKLVRDVLIILFTIEFVMIIVMGFYLYFRGYFEIGESFFQAFFLTISMTANAGFDITGDSLFRYNADYVFQLMAMFLMFTGAVGFWPLVELKDWFIAKRKKEKFQFSLFSKILVYMHVGLWILGAVIVFLIERGNFFIDLSVIEQTFYSLFMSLTTRNAGFATMDIVNFKDATLLLFIVFMFIGSSPNSAGGGIRTTTFLVVLASIFSFSKSRDQVLLHKKAVKPETVMKSIIVIVVATFVVVTSTFMILAFDNITFKESLFEVASAFGTTGLSLGVTAGLNSFSKFVLIITMFIGRIGIVALLLFMQGHKKAQKIKYPEINLIVG
ncbi:TrkH family potassium uptake protein [Mycoplasmatota bacterium]|nr:TrkH family potassium uptake protein [Mycoplasmatota bacterium]